MGYDHSKKAGNEGDVVKHPALIAALDAVLAAQGALGRPFHYLDMFAGCASHKLSGANGGEWRNGVGMLASKEVPSGAPEAVKAWFGMWRLPDPTAAGRLYPGSSWIAADRCRHANRQVKLELYDSCAEVRADLKKEWGEQHSIGESLFPLDRAESRIEAPDFLFVDPPGWRKAEHPGYPAYRDVLEKVLCPRGSACSALAKATLVWMPSAGNDGAFECSSTSKAWQASGAGYDWSAIRWKAAGSGSACVMLYNCAVAEIRAAIDCIVGMCGGKWHVRHSAECSPRA